MNANTRKSSRKSIAVVTTDAAKHEEIAALEKICTLAEDGTYLHNLLSQNLIDWFAQQVNWDFSCDIYGDFQHSVETATGTISDLRLDVQRLERELERAKNESTHEIDNLQHELKFYKERLEKVQDAYHNLSGENYQRVIDASKAEEEKKELQAELARVRAENAALKVKLYDIEHPFEPEEDSTATQP